MIQFFKKSYNMKKIYFIVNEIFLCDTKILKIPHFIHCVVALDNQPFLLLRILIHIRKTNKNIKKNEKTVETTMICV